MERVLSAALVLLYKRALLSASGAFDPADYTLGGPRDTNTANVERLPKVSVEHLAAIDRFSALLPRFMEERRRIQALRVRSDDQILPLLGRAFEPQFAGTEYATAARGLASALSLYDITAQGAPNRVLVAASAGEGKAAREVAARLKTHLPVALVLVSEDAPSTAKDEGGLATHYYRRSDPALHSLAEQADVILAYPGVARLPAIATCPAVVAAMDEHTGDAPVPHAAVLASSDLAALLAFCKLPR